MQYKIFKREWLATAFSSATEAESISPISCEVASKVTFFSTASLWQLLLSCCRKAIVPSFQLVKPLEIYTDTAYISIK